MVENVKRKYSVAGPWAYRGLKVPSVSLAEREGLSFPPFTQCSDPPVSPQGPPQPSQLWQRHRLGAEGLDSLPSRATNSLCDFNHVMPLSAYLASVSPPKTKGCAEQYRRVAPLALIVSVSRPETIASGYIQTFFCLSYTVFEFFFQLVGNTGKMSHINLNVRRSRKILSFHC